MAKQRIRQEIYDENGLVRVEFIEIDGPSTEELITQKEDELLRIYEEIQRLKESRDNWYFIFLCIY